MKRSVAQVAPHRMKPFNRRVLRLGAANEPTGAAPSDASQRRRVLIVDDHPMMRDRIAEIINSEDDLMVCGEAEDRARALVVAATTRPALAIVDLSIKGSSGLDLIKDLHLQHPKLPILVFSMHDESVYAERAVHAGARGYLNKSGDARTVIQAIRKILAGDFYLSPELTQQILGKMAGAKPEAPVSRVENLADRELEILRLIGQGYRKKKIAESLHLSPSTVATYKERLKAKLELKDASELLQYAIRWEQSQKSH